MHPTTLTLHTQFAIGPVDPRLFGGFLEHIGRAVYEGVYDPDSPQADADGLRTDLRAALARLDMTNMRYPGGNFVSAYHWQDGIGPRAQRPTVFDLAWHSPEPNHFGTDEYLALCAKMGWAPVLTVNLGTGTPEEARNWVEYCNAPTGTRFADQRAANGHPAPYDVKLWYLGNEMDGWWQMGHVPADQYAIRAQQAAKLMKEVDPTIAVVACGSCTIILPTYMEWDRQVLDYMGDITDYISLHRYVGNSEHDTPDFLAVTNAIDRQIEEMDAVCRFVQARRKSARRVFLAFDEWNVWYKNMEYEGRGQFAPHLLEEIYNLEDALVVAGFLNSFIRHADVVKIANLAQIVNVLAPLQTRRDDVLIQTTFYPFEMYTRRRNGLALQPQISGPSYTGKTNGLVPYLDASAILDGDRLHVFATNRSLDQALPLTIHLADRALAALAEAELLTGPSAESANTFEQPNVVQPRPFSDVTISAGQATLSLPPLSLAAMTFRLA